MMKLRAEIKKDLGKTKHSLGHIEDGEPVDIKRLPFAKWLEIVEDKSGVYLYHYIADGECISDTWHLSVNEAMAQAEFEFQIKQTEWCKIE